MSKNIDQVYTANPITTNAGTDLMYFGQAPYGAGDDAAMLFSNFASQFQSGRFNYSTDSGIDGTAYIATLSPAPSALVDGLTVILRPNSTNTTSLPTLDVNGLGAKLVYIKPALIPLAIGDIRSNIDAIFQYNADEDYWALLNPWSSLTAAWKASQGDGFGNTFAMTDTGALNAYAATNAAYPSAPLNLPISVMLIPDTTNTGAATFDYNGSGAINITLPDQTSLTGGEIVADNVAVLAYSTGPGTWVLLNSQITAGGVTASQVQHSAFNYAIDTGVDGTAYVTSLTPALLSYSENVIIFLSTTHFNLISNPTLDVDGLGPKTIVNTVGYPLGINDIPASGALSILQYNSSLDSFSLLNPFNALSVPYLGSNGIGIGSIIPVINTGSANVYSGNNDVFPAPSLSSSITVVVSSCQPNTSNATFNYSGTGDFNIFLPDQTFLSGGEILLDTPAVLVWSLNLGGWILTNSALGGSAVTPDALQRQVYTFAFDSGSTNAVVLPITPTITSNANVFVSFLCANDNTGTTTIDCGFGALELVTNGGGFGTSLVGGELLAGGIYIAIYNSGLNKYVLFNSSTVAPTAAQVQTNAFNYGTDSGSTASVYETSITPALTFYSQGFTLILDSVQHTNNGPSTLDVNGLGPVSIVTSDLKPLIGGEIRTGGTYEFVYNYFNNLFEIINSSTPSVISSVIPSGSAVTFASNTDTDLTSISLVPGEWDIWANINYLSLGTVPTQVNAWISTTSATQPDESLYNSSPTDTLTANIGISAPYQPYTIASPTTIYLSGKILNTSGDGTACGGIYARRIK